MSGSGLELGAGIGLKSGLGSRSGLGAGIGLDSGSVSLAGLGARAHGEHGERGERGACFGRAQPIRLASTWRACQQCADVVNVNNGVHTRVIIDANMCQRPNWRTCVIHVGLTGMRKCHRPNWRTCVIGLTGILAGELAPSHPRAPGFCQ